MRKLLQAGCLFALAALASCDGDASSTQTSSKQSAATKAQPLTLTTSSAGLVQETTPKGVKAGLQGHFENAVIVRRNADGTLTTECHDEQQQAEAFMQGGATPTNPEVK